MLGAADRARSHAGIESAGIFAWWGVTAVLAAAGCAGRHLSREPMQIALRNGTGRPLASMAVHEQAAEELGRRCEARIDLAGALRDATTRPGEILVFEFRPNGTAIAHIDRP